MADDPNPSSPSGPGQGYRDHGNQPSRHEEGRRSSSHEENRRQIVEGPIAHTDSIHNPSVSSGAAAGGAAAGGAAAGGAAANLKEEEEHFSPRERKPSPEASASDEGRRRYHHGRRRHSRRGHRRRSFSPVGKGAAGEALPPQSLVSTPQQSLVSDSNIVMLNVLLDRSLREEGLTSNIADLLSTPTGRVQITPPESSNPSAGSSVPPAPPMSMTMTDFGAVSNFSGDENDKKKQHPERHGSVRGLCYSCIEITSWRHRRRDGLLVAYFLFVLKDVAIRF